MHIKPNGGAEWLWGYYRERIDDDLEGIEIVVSDYKASFKCLALDAINVKTWRSMHHASPSAGSKLIIAGIEYKVREQKVIGEAVEMMLGKDCCAAKVHLNPPNCRDQTLRMNSLGDLC